MIERTEIVRQRKLLGFTQKELSKAASVSYMRLVFFEGERSTLTSSELRALRVALKRRAAKIVQEFKLAA